jgi:hypothetical protein
MDPWYWVYKEPTPSQLEDETDQFAELTEHLLREYKGKTFILQVMMMMMMMRRFTHSNLLLDKIHLP